MFARAAVTALNHLLQGAGWARERLRPFAGRHLRVTGGPLALDLAVDGEGYFRPVEAGSASAPAVTIELPADTPFRLLTDRDSVFAAAKLAGTADFTEALAFVFRHLRWDVEEDLAKVVGDIAAHRLVRTGQGFFAWQRSAGANLAANAAEYLREEADVLVAQPALARFGRDVEALREEAAQLERRLSGLI